MGAEALGIIPRLLWKHGTMTAHEMFDVIGHIYTMKEIYAKIHHAKNHRKIRVVTWVWGNTRPRRMRAVFAFGPGPNIPRPKPPSKTEKTRARRAMLKARQASCSVFAYGTSYGGGSPSL